MLSKFIYLFCICGFTENNQIRPKNRATLIGASLSRMLRISKAMSLQWLFDALKLSFVAVLNGFMKILELGSLDL